jgi:hypothetical protein
MLQDHDIDMAALYSVAALDPPRNTPTPWWVSSYTTFGPGTLTATLTPLRPWSEYGITCNVTVIYRPGQHVGGIDPVRFTMLDTPSDGTQPLMAATAPYLFRFNITQVDAAPVAIPLKLPVGSGPAIMRRLTYYDLERPQSQLFVTLDPRQGYFDPAGNTTHTITTAHGRVTLLPAESINASDWNVTSRESSRDGTREAVVFRYEPNGGEYADSDSFAFTVFDGKQTATGLVTIARTVPGEDKLRKFSCTFLNHHTLLSLPMLILANWLLAIIIILPLQLLLFLVAYYLYRRHRQKALSSGPSRVRFLVSSLTNSFRFLVKRVPL